MNLYGLTVTLLNFRPQYFFFNFSSAGYLFDVDFPYVPVIYKFMYTVYMWNGLEWYFYYFLGYSISLGDYILMETFRQ